MTRFGGRKALPEAEKIARGARLRELRKRLALSQEAVARKGGKPEFVRASVAKIERGDNAATTADVLTVLATAFGVDLQVIRSYLDGKLSVDDVIAARDSNPPDASAAVDAVASSATPEPDALEVVLQTMEWPADVDIEAADLAIAAAREEARAKGKDRPGPLWAARLLQLYRERLDRAPASSTVPNVVSLAEALPAPAFYRELQKMPSLTDWLSKATSNDVSVTELARAVSAIASGKAAAYSATNDFRGRVVPRDGWSVFFEDVRNNKMREQPAQERPLDKMRAAEGPRKKIVIDGKPVAAAARRGR